MIFAKLDVTLAYHAKAHKAGGAMATWAWALAYTREQELDGFVPVDSLRLAWVGEAQARKDCDRLVLVGLFAQSEGGWVMCKYGDKNETKATIDVRRGEARERMLRVRANKQRTSGEPSANVQRTDRVRSVDVPGSGSGSGSVSDSGSEIASPDGSPPPWWGLACDVVESTTGAQLQRGAAWLRYSGHRRTNGKPLGQQDAQYWLATVDVREAAADRRRDQLAQDNANANRNRRFEGPPKPPPITAEQSKRFAAELEQRLMAKKASGA